jgi:hypothetical protein
MSKASTYSPVATFELHKRSGKLAGFAAPAKGVSPCLIRLSSDDASIAFARATRHDADAARRGLRYGWCGFEIAGLRQAFAIGDTVRLSCGVTGETLAEIPFDASLFEAVTVTSRTLSVGDLTRLVRSGEMCADVDDLVPFAVSHYQHHGARAFVEASYQTLLRRWPDATAPGVGDVDSESLELAVAIYLRSMADSDEFQNQWSAELPGPYHDAFRFDRRLLA